MSSATAVSHGHDNYQAIAQLPIAGRRCGLVTNHTGRNRAAFSTLAILTESGANVRKVFSPEHGPAGVLEGSVASSTVDGLTCHSLYGETRRPTSAMLGGLDTVVFDIQDAGARFYTYATTLCYVMEECAAHGIAFAVLDRPNPLGGDVVEGPAIDEEERSFVGYARVPVRHGLTLGELARWHRTDANLDVELHVVPVMGWSRSMTWPQTGLPWIAPSPNLPDYAAAEWYPGACLLEFSDLSVGRGTAAPFALIGAPWLDPQLVLEDSATWPATILENVALEPANFTPGRATHAGQPCRGLRLRKKGDEAIRTVGLGMALLCSLHLTHPREFDEARLRAALPLLGSKAALEALASGDLAGALAIAGRDAQAFAQARGAALLY